MDENIRKALLKKRITQEECCKRLGRTRDDLIGHIQPAVALELEFLLDVSAEKVCGASPAELTKPREQFLKALSSKEMQDFARKFPIKQLKKLGYLPGTYPLPYEILKFMGVSSIEGWKTYYGPLQGTVNPYAYSAWIRLGELQCQRPTTEIPLDKNEITQNLAYLRKNSISLQTNLRNIATEALGECNIQVVQIPAFLTAPLPDAACYWCGNRPVIQVPTSSSIDARFLKAIFHAVGHILLHPKRTICLQGISTCFKPTPDRLESEQEANLFAERHLLTEAEECEIICCGRFAEKRCIQYFSSVFKVRPGIIVDRLQDIKKLPSRTLLNSLKIAV